MSIRSLVNSLCTVIIFGIFNLLLVGGAISSFKFGAGDDRWIWKVESSGHFLVTSIRRLTDGKNHFLIWAYGVIYKECGDFLPWLRHKSGAEISSVLSIGKSIYGRSLFACKPIQAGDCILKVPYSVQLAPDNLHPSINSLLGEDVGNVAKLALVILLHQRLAEIPFADFFNHDANSETDVLSGDFKQVSEVLIKYRKFSNARLLLDFGFIIPSNKYDQVKVEVNAPQNDHLHALKLELLHRHTLVGIWSNFDLTSMGV
ncbi:hypothetical protein HanPI659440_Chr11g0433021 [Helianthus annuus]|nr:hypothetical protein HanPI659440_Chr11g0433021 [Helianthus annuus]